MIDYDNSDVFENCETLVANTFDCDMSTNFSSIDPLKNDEVGDKE